MFLFTFLGTLFVSGGLAYAGSGITYHGRILRPNNTPVNSSNVQFRIQIRTPGTENCLLWEEQQTKDLSTSNGTFTITIADSLEPSLIPNSLPYQLERVFSNRTNFTSLTGCALGSSYNPTGSDGRNLLVQFREDPAAAWETMPATKINFVPLALNSMMLEGYRATEFLKIDAASSYTPLSAVQVNTLVDIVAGTSSQYLKPSTSFSGDVSGSYNTTSVDKIKSVDVSSTAPVNGQVLKLVGGVWTPAADDSGTSPGDASYSAKGLVQINASQATSGLYINNGVLALPNIIGSGTIGGASTIPVITFDQKGRLTTVTSAAVNDTTKLPLAGGTMTGSINMGTQNITNATSIASTNVSARNVVLADNDNNTVTIRAPADVTSNYNLTLPADGGTSGFVLSTDGSGGTSWITPPTSGVTPAAYAADVAPAASCTTTQTPYWNTVADTWACQNIKVTGAGAFIVDGGNTLGAAATIGTNDNYSLNFKTNNTTKMSVLADGKVGIANTTPVGLLDVKGTGGQLVVRSTSASNCDNVALSLVTDNQNDSVIFGSYANRGWILGSSNFASNCGGGESGDFYIGIAKADNSTHRPFTIDFTTEYVGIGTQLPSSVLDVNGAVTHRGIASPAVSASGQGRIYFDSSSNTYKVSQNGGAYIDLVTSASSFVSQTNYTADVTPAASCTTLQTPYWNTVADTWACQNIKVTGAGAFFVDGGNSLGAAATIGTNDNNNLNFETNNGTKMTLLPGGNVGVGTTTPVEKLEVSGGIRVGNTSGTNAGTIRWDGTSFQGYMGTSWVNLSGSTPAGTTTCDTTQTFSTSGTYTYNVPASFGSITIKIWGGGGGGGASHANNTASNGGPGGSTTINSLGLFAGGGAGGGAASFTSGITLGSGGAGGTASGGSINQNGAAGTAGNTNAGAGGSAPYGGAGGFLNVGSSPGGGGGGSTNGGYNSGGGGSGAYSERTYSSTTLIPGTSINDIVVGAAGNRGTGWSDGYIGGTGRVTITCSSTGTPPANDRAVVFMNSGVYSNSPNFIYSASGSLGLGTTSPSSKLHIEDTVPAAALEMRIRNLASTGKSDLVMYNDTGAYAGLEVYGSSHASTGNRNSAVLTSSNNIAFMTNSGLQNGGSGTIQFLTGGWDSSTQTRMTIAADGKIGIGLTNPSEALEVSGSVKATSFISTSDARLKTHIEPISGLDSILKLQGVQYRWKDSGEPDAGVLAQEVEKVFPDAVRTNSQTGFKGVKYQYLIAPLIESTKDLYKMCKIQNETQSKINSKLIMENQTLKEENEKLKKRLDKIEKLLGLQ